MITSRKILNLLNETEEGPIGEITRYFFNQTKRLQNIRIKYINQSLHVQERVKLNPNSPNLKNSQIFIQEFLRRLNSKISAKLISNQNSKYLIGFNIPSFDKSPVKLSIIFDTKQDLEKGWMAEVDIYLDIPYLSSISNWTDNLKNQILQFIKSVFDIFITQFKPLSIGTN